MPSRGADDTGRAIMPSRGRSRKKPDNVLSLRGAVPAHGVPDEEICSKLRELLALAEDGALSGVILGWIGPGHGISTTWGGRACIHELVAASAMLHGRIMAAWIADDD
jgi:hypothetical protein